MDAYPHVRAWLQRIDALPGFVPMQSAPVAWQHGESPERVDNGDPDVHQC